MSSKGSTPGSQDLRVPNALAQEYLRTNEGIRLKPSSVKTYDSHLTQYTAFLHDSDMTVLSAEFTDVVEFIENCVRIENRRSTVSSKLTTIAELYRYIRLRTDSRDELRLAPIRFREIDLDRYNTPEPLEREALSKEEIRRLFDAFDSYRNRLMAIVGVETGIRNSDIRNLLLQNIRDDEIHVQDPKNSKAYDVPISNQLRHEFEMWEKHHRTGYAAASESEYVFPSQRGEKLSNNSSLNNIVKDAAERAGLQEVIGRSPITERKQDTLDTDKSHIEWKRVTVHTLRHSYITLLEKAGVSLPYRQLVANHSNAETTLGYSHGMNNVFEDIRDQYDPPR